MDCPASAGRPRFDMADIVRQHRAELEARATLSPEQARVLSAIALCRTEALGGHVDVCRSCGYKQPAYNSCRNRHCPKCQALAQERWIAARSARLLPVQHFHVVFTLPGRLRSLARFRPREVFDALFQAASETLLELGDTRLAARLAITMVLHTWARDLRWHPHVHAIVSAGGLARDLQHWIPTRPRYLFPVRVMGALFRGKMIARLRDLHDQGVFAGFDEFDDPEGFERLVARVARTRWVVYAKQPFRQALHVLRYLGRYTHRVAISNSRFTAVSSEAVTFRTRNGNTVTVTPFEFLRRFVTHVLPDRFHKIRHYGLYAGASTEHALAVACLRPAAPQSPAPTHDVSKEISWITLLFHLTLRDVDRCPNCGDIVEHIHVPATARAPPHRAVR